MDGERLSNWDVRAVLYPSRANATKPIGKVDESRGRWHVCGQTESSKKSMAATVINSPDKVGNS